MAADWRDPFEGIAPFDGIAAYVDDSAVTVGEVKDSIASLIPELNAVYQGAELKDKLRDVYTNALQQLIDVKLIVKAYDADTKYNKDAVEKYVEKRIGEFIQKRFQGDRQAMMKALKDEHLSWDEWRRHFREGIIVDMVRDREVDSKVVVSPRDVQQVYESRSDKYQRPERVRLRVILIHGSTNETERMVRLKQAQETAARVKGGEDFSDQARRFSEDGKAEKGGEWDWMDTADLRKELAGAISNTAEGGISGVIPVDGDYYLVQVVQRQPAGPVPFEEARHEIEKGLRRQEMRRQYAVWMERLKRDAFIEIVKPAGP
jgi:parvulin-like peptidyl-prolyl isomerase